MLAPSILNGREYHTRLLRPQRIHDTQFQKFRSRGVRPQLRVQRAGAVVPLVPQLEPFVEQPHGHLGLHQVLHLRRPLAHRSRGCRAPGGRHQRAIQARAADKRLRGLVGRLHQPQLALQTGQREHPVLL